MISFLAAFGIEHVVVVVAVVYDAAVDTALDLVSEPDDHFERHRF